MSNAYIPPAQLLRTALKTAGFNQRRVTVRERFSTLYVTVRDAGVSLSAIKAIADSFRSVRYCEGSGEMLCGGNTFVEVAYVDEIIAPVAAAVAAILAPAGDGLTVELAGGFQAAKMSPALGSTFPDEVLIWGPGFETCDRRVCGVGYAAKLIAAAYLDARASRSAGAALSR